MASSEFYRKRGTRETGRRAQSGKASLHYSPYAGPLQLTNDRPRIYVVFPTLIRKHISFSGHNDLVEAGLASQLPCQPDLHPFDVLSRPILFGGGWVGD